jgi:hypothetical protein
MSTAVFDIETGPRPDEELASMMPEFEAPKNYKDADKIKSYIEAERRDWLEKAALSPVTGRVLAIGVRTKDGNEIFSDDEKVALLAFWSRLTDLARARVQMVGFDIFRFDLPFLMRRSWVNGVKVPDGLIDARGYFNRVNFVDLIEVWRCGDRATSISLDNLSKFLGVGAKTGDGAHFAKLWATERKLAIAYLENDLALTEGVARRLGVWVSDGAEGKAYVTPALSAVPEKQPAPAAAELVLSSEDY